MREGKLILFVVITSLFMIVNISVTFINTCYPLRYVHIIRQSAQKYNLDAALIVAIIYSESRFNCEAKSSKGAIGLMQLMPQTAKAFYEGECEFNEKVLYSPESNIAIGSKYLRYLFDKYNDEIMVLSSYNAGESIALSWRGDCDTLKKTQIKYKETLQYVEKVQKAKKLYKHRI